MAGMATAPGATAAGSAGRGASARPGPGGLAGRNAPPFRLPGQHFAAAVVFLLAGAAGLVWVAPELAYGWYPSARVVAVVHLFTLGWLTLSIWGALYQFLPVALGEPIRWPWLADLTYLLFVPGLAAFVAGLGLGGSRPLLVGVAFFGTAVLLFAVNLGGTLARAEKRDVTWWALVGANTSLVLMFLVGAALAGNLQWGFLGLGRWAALGVHMHVALAGWVGLVVIGVAHRLLPMFLLSHGAPEGWGKAAAGLVSAGVLSLVLLHHFGVVLGRWLPAALIGAGLASFLVQARLFYVHRVRRKLDAGLRGAAVGLALVAGGLVLGAVALATSFASPRLATAYGLSLVLGLSVFVAAHYYKIVPFLVWYHRYGPRVSRGPVPQVAELYSGRWASWAGALIGAGAAGLVVMVVLGEQTGARVAAGVMAAGVLVEAIQMGGLSWKRP